MQRINDKAFISWNISNRTLQSRATDDRHNMRARYGFQVCTPFLDKGILGAQYQTNYYTTSYGVVDPGYAEFVGWSYFFVIECSDFSYCQHLFAGRNMFDMREMRQLYHSRVFAVSGTIFWGIVGELFIGVSLSPSEKSICELPFGESSGANLVPPSRSKDSPML
jgi:hypothetical protein